MVALSSLEKICVGVIAGVLLVSIVGAFKVGIVALLVGAGSYGVRALRAAKKVA